jgi:aspartyl/asparaginyl beta-hydroxylase (cupin superfamily)
MRFSCSTISILLVATLVPEHSNGFVVLPVESSNCRLGEQLAASKGFGVVSPSGGPGDKKKKSKKSKSANKSKAPVVKPAAAVAKPYVKSEQDDFIESLFKATANTAIGQAVASSPYSGTSEADPFWELMPSLLSSRFPIFKDDQLQRVAGMIRHAVNPGTQLLEDSIIQDPHRPHDEIHAYMPGLGPTKPFHDPKELSLCQKLSDNYDTIVEEYNALLQDMEKPGGKDRFQSVTSMNYESGWRTLVLFYNGHRIPGFPYHLCPVTTQLLETVPLAGRIAGFNRQQAQTGIPLHSDGNNMWLTCQMGIAVPEDDKAYIRVGPETKRWKERECLLYDTTYEHETMNDHADQERVVLHVDFFNTLAMTPIEIEVMQYIYSLREEFMKAEGVSKVGAQIL